MGALASSSAHARPSTQAPIDTSGNFYPKYYFFVWNSEAYNYSFWEKSMCGRRTKNKEREKNVVNSGHLVPWQRT